MQTNYPQSVYPLEENNQYASTVGYMLKVLHNQKDTTRFDREFKCIRHGNYRSFIDLIGAKEVFLVSMNLLDGTYKDNNFTIENDGDLAMMFRANPSLEKYINICHKHYGDFVDVDGIENVIYKRLAVFEFTLRAHANKHHLIDLSKENTLNVVMKALFKHLQFTNQTIDILTKGRHFLNDIKHSHESGHKSKFKSVAEGLLAFDQAYLELRKMKLIN